MKKIRCFWGLGFLLLASCQKELHFPPSDYVVVPQEKLVASIVVQDVAQNDYDSIRFRYFTDRILEVHYVVTGDSLRRTYYYDANERLVRLEDERAIFYTNNNNARRISFNTTRMENWCKPSLISMACLALRHILIISSKVIIK